MTADAPKRRRGRPLKLLVGDPFAAPSVDQQRWGSLVTALAAVELRRSGGQPLLLGEALAERMFPTDDWPRYTAPHDPPGRGAAIRNADGRAHEAVERWLRQRSDLPWRQSIDTAQRARKVRQWGERHRGLAERLEAFAAAPHDPAVVAAAAEALGKMPPEPRLPGQTLLEPDPEHPDPEREPDPERLTPERLREAPGGDPAERDTTAAAAKELAADCRRVAADVNEWLEENDTRYGRRALAHTVAAIVADLFNAAGAGGAVVFNRQSAIAAGAGPRGPVGAYCVAVEAALKALDPRLSTSWRTAAETVCADRTASADAGG